MLIRRRADIVILGFLLLAEVRSSIAQKNGYAYPKPSVAFGDGFQQRPQYVVSTSTVKPSVDFTGFSQTVQKPQVAFQGFEQQPVKTEPQEHLILPQVNFQEAQGISQEFFRPEVSQSTTSYVHPAAPTTIRPVVTQKPTQSYLPPKHQGATLSGTKPQIAFQGFTASSKPRPVVAASKPQGSFNGFQGFSQTVQKPAVSTTTFSQTGQQYVKPADGAGLYQAPAVSTTYRPQVSVVKPQASFQGFTASSTQRPVTAAVKPQASFSGFQGFSQTEQKPAVSSTTFSQTGQQYVKPADGTGLYQAPAVTNTYRPQVSVVKPQASFQGFTASSTSRPVAFTAEPEINVSNFQSFQKPSTAFNQVVKPSGGFSTFQQTESLKPANLGVSSLSSQAQLSNLGPKGQAATFTVSKPQATYQGFSGSTTTRRPVVAVKPQASLSGFQGFSQAEQKPGASTTTFSQTGQQYVKPADGTGLYQAPAVTNTYRPQVSVVKPQASFQGFTASSTSRPVAFTAEPEINVSNFQSFQKPSTAFNQVVKPSGGFSTFQQTESLKPANLGVSSLSSQAQLSYLPPKGQAATFTVSKPQAASQGFSGSTTTRRPVVAVKPQASFSGFQGSGQSFSHIGQQSVKPAVVSGQYQAPAVSTTYRPQVSSVVTSSTPRPEVGSNGFQGFQGFQSKPAITTLSQVGQQVVKPEAVTGQYHGAVVPTTYRPQVSTVVSAVKPQNVFQGFTGSTVPKPAFVTSRPQANFGGLQGYSQQSYIQRPAVSTTTFNQLGQQVVKPAAVTGIYKPSVVSTTLRPQVSVPSVKPQDGFSGFQGFGQSDNTQTPSLAYLPPKGQQGSNSQVGFKGLQAPNQSGRYKSFFELASATANQVVDVPQENEFDGPLEQQVENVGFKENSQINTIQGQQQDSSLGYTQFGNPDQATVQAQLTVIDRDQSSIPVTPGSISDQYQDFDDFDQSRSESQFLPDYRTIDNFQVANQLQAQNYQQYYDSPSNLYGAPVTFAESSNVVNSQIDNDSQVQDPQPLNREEQQVRQLQEKADSDKEELAIKNLETGMNAGPHVNPNSDKEYNVFDYDQYSAAPVEAET